MARLHPAAIVGTVLLLFLLLFAKLFCTLCEGGKCYSSPA